MKLITKIAIPMYTKKSRTLICRHNGSGSSVLRDPIWGGVIRYDRYLRILLPELFRNDGMIRMQRQIAINVKASAIIGARSAPSSSICIIYQSTPALNQIVEF